MENEAAAAAAATGKGAKCPKITVLHKKGKTKRKNRLKAEKLGLFFFLFFFLPREKKERRNRRRDRLCR